jgi:putative transposase
VYTYFRNWRQDGTWLKIHDLLRQWSRIEHERHPNPSEALVDSQSVKSAAGVAQAVGFDGAKLLKGRKRFLTVDTLGLVMRVFVTAASVGERKAANKCSSTSSRWVERHPVYIPFGLMAALMGSHSCGG